MAPITLRISRRPPCWEPGELIQVAAMAEKALLGYEIMKEEHKNEKTAESDGKG